MLPGFRFLFTAIVLSMSVLVFGLGAAALLRAAHEEFANLPSRRAAPEPMFARQNDDPLPTLALLRVEPPAVEKPADNVPAATVPETASDSPAAVGQTPEASPVESGNLAVLKPAEPMQAEAAKEATKEATKPEPPAQEASADTPPAPVSPAATDAPATNTEVKLAAVAETPGPSAVATSSPAEPTEAASPESSPAVTRIATLGGPAVLINEKTSITDAKTDRRAIKKLAAQRAREKRRIAAARRARLAREAALTLQQQQPNPFLPLPVMRATR
ncbi:hypothetical protein [Bradyrhizobium australiense]|uniref:Uncharacterized protein n=1 Tax=Bradyrhizobium australiense TaxID=2721161 RepID=A0A7Y4LTQ6_9BRAD|nr:hypothetical protein [Bradyrhizobium australiense]NOJ38189.1 hypothetical protein [Bradyrhizobium australiense]